MSEKRLDTLKGKRFGQKSEHNPREKRLRCNFVFIFSLPHTKKEITKFAKIIAFPSFGKRNPLLFVAAGKSNFTNYFKRVYHYSLIANEISELPIAEKHL